MSQFACTAKYWLLQTPQVLIHNLLHVTIKKQEKQEVPPLSETSFNSWGSTYSQGSSLKMSWAPWRGSIFIIPSIPSHASLFFNVNIRYTDMFEALRASHKVIYRTINSHLPWTHCRCQWTQMWEVQWTWAWDLRIFHTHNPSPPGWPGWRFCSCAPYQCAVKRQIWKHVPKHWTKYITLA